MLPQVQALRCQNGAAVFASRPQLHKRCSVDSQRLQLQLARSLQQPHVQDKQVARSSNESNPASQVPQQRDAQSNISSECNACSSVLQLGQLSTPETLQQAWQQQILPKCRGAWSSLHEDCNRILQDDVDIEQQQREPAADDDNVTWPHGFLYKLDILLGELQQVLLLCGLLKDQHTQQQWRAAAAAVFVDARAMEQQVCSDMLVQQGLVLAYQALLQQQQQQQSHKDLECRDRQSLLLSKALLKHMELEGLSPQGFAGMNRLSPSGTAEPQVLTLEQQQQLLVGLHTEQRLLVKRLQDLLLSPNMAPVVQLDEDSRRVLLKPLAAAAAAKPAVAAAAAATTTTPAVAAAAAATMPAVAPAAATPAVAAAALTAPAATVAQTQPVASNCSTPTPTTDCRLAAAAAAAVVASTADAHTAAAAADESNLVLHLGLVQQLLQLHPDAAVRQDVYDAGLLQQLDRLLTAWGGLAEVRRKTARMQGYSSYADMVLKHSLIGSPQAAAAFCEQMALALQARAAAAVQRIVAQKQCSAGHADVAAAADVLGSDLERYLYKSQLDVLSHKDLQQLQPYLMFDQVLTGFDQLLQLSVGVTMTKREAAAGEVWNDQIRVYELHRTAHHLNTQQQQQQQEDMHMAGSSSSSGGRGFLSKQPLQLDRNTNLLGTLYIDPVGGYSAQLVAYGSKYDNSLQQFSNQTSSSRSGSKGTAPAVALGLQSGGTLCGSSHNELALGLWELCHELGHAVNFLLSASATGNFLVRAEDEDHHQVDQTPHSSQHHQQQQSAAYHMHAAWLPLELLELPSTLFEVFCMDAQCLQVVCRHHTTGQQLPWELAEKLALFMSERHNNPLFQQHIVLSMLVDLQLSSISSKPLGRHTAHRVWQAAVMSPQLSAIPAVEVSLQQVSSVPRLLVSGGQGYGYAVAWCLAQLLQPALLLHIHQALDDQIDSKAAAAAGTVHDSFREAAAVDATSGHSNASDLARKQRLWRHFLSQGGSLNDVAHLVQLVVQLQMQQLPKCGQQQQQQRQSRGKQQQQQQLDGHGNVVAGVPSSHTSATLGSSTEQVLLEQLQVVSLLNVLTEQGMLQAPVMGVDALIGTDVQLRKDVDPLELLTVCFRAVF